MQLYFVTKSIVASVLVLDLISFCLVFSGFVLLHHNGTRLYFRKRGHIRFLTISLAFILIDAMLLQSVYIVIMYLGIFSSQLFLTVHNICVLAIIAIFLARLQLYVYKINKMKPMFNKRTKTHQSIKNQSRSSLNSINSNDKRQSLRISIASIPNTPSISNQKFQQCIQTLCNRKCDILARVIIISVLIWVLESTIFIFIRVFFHNISKRRQILKIFEISFFGIILVLKGIILKIFTNDGNILGFNDHWYIRQELKKISYLFIIIASILLITTVLMILSINSNSNIKILLNNNESIIFLGQSIKEICIAML